MRNALYLSAVAVLFFLLGLFSNERYPELSLALFIGSAVAVVAALVVIAIQEAVDKIISGLSTRGQ